MPRSHRHDSRPLTVKNALRTLDVRPQKSRGQNFVIDPSVTHSIVQFGAPEAHEHILEIGPGLGALTSHLQDGASFTAIEIEEQFCRELAQRYPDADIVNEDVRTVDFSNFGKKFTVFGNLPYSFSTEILFHLIGARAVIERSVLLLQKEFAERVSAPPGKKDYGVLSIMCQQWADLERGPIFPGNVFHPPAKVDSMVVELKMRNRPRVEVESESNFSTVVRAAFWQRRKKIRNSMPAYGFASQREVDEALAAANISGDRRAETVSIEEFGALSDVMGRVLNQRRSS